MTVGMQVLGGAGPAIAAVPLTVVWAGGSAVTLLSSLGTGKVGPVGAVQRVGFTVSMAFAQVSLLPKTRKPVCQTAMQAQGCC